MPDLQGLRACSGTERRSVARDWLVDQKWCEKNNESSLDDCKNRIFGDSKNRNGNLSLYGGLLFLLFTGISINVFGAFKAI